MNSYGPKSVVPFAWMGSSLHRKKLPHTSEGRKLVGHPAIFFIGRCKSGSACNTAMVSLLLGGRASRTFAERGQSSCHSDLIACGVHVMDVVRAINGPIKSAAILARQLMYVASRHVDVGPGAQGLWLLTLHFDLSRAAGECYLLIGGVPVTRHNASAAHFDQHY